MRPQQKSNRNRGKNNRPNHKSLGNVINRVFDSSGPEGKVRGTPQQIIDKYEQLARDAQTSDDRVTAENFLQHAEHYLRLLTEAQAEQAAHQQAQAAQRREQEGSHNRRQDDGANQHAHQQGGGFGQGPQPSGQPQPEFTPQPVGAASDAPSGALEVLDGEPGALVPTPEAGGGQPEEAPQPRAARAPRRRRSPRRDRAEADAPEAGATAETVPVANDTSAPAPLPAPKAAKAKSKPAPTSEKDDAETAA